MIAKALCLRRRKSSAPDRQSGLVIVLVLLVLPVVIFLFASAWNLYFLFTAARQLKLAAIVGADVAAYNYLLFCGPAEGVDVAKQDGWDGTCQHPNPPSLQNALIEPGGWGTLPANRPADAVPERISRALAVQKLLTRGDNQIGALLVELGYVERGDFYLVSSELNSPAGFADLNTKLVEDLGTGFVRVPAVRVRIVPTEGSSILSVLPHWIGSRYFGVRASAVTAVRTRVALEQCPVCRHGRLYRVE